MNASTPTRLENLAVSLTATLDAPAPTPATPIDYGAASPAARPRRRTVYAEGERQASLGRLTTRCPTILRDYLKFTASHPLSGYRSFTHMVTVGLIEFLEKLPAPGDSSSAKPEWAKGRGASEGTVLVHVNTERTVSRCGGAVVDGCELAQRAVAVAESHGVNMSALTLTLLCWMATEKHPAADAKMRRALVVATKECYA